jgi:rSAM/selenodomain-associated transferase 1
VSRGVALVVIAKAPAPGRSKTRLCPPCTKAEAAELAAAALEDTLAAALATPARRHLLALDGDARGWRRAGLEVQPQRGEGLGARLAHALERAGGPALVVGMDTPQVDPVVLGEACARLLEPGVDAVLGDAPDGGYWAIGLRRPDPEVFRDVPMSVGITGRVQRRRLAELELRTATLPALRDVDTFEDATAVARAAPLTRFARAFRALSAADTADHEETVPEAAAGVRL